MSQTADFMPKKINRLHWLGGLARSWVVDQIPLIEAFWVAASLHVLFFPVIWASGWMLPWPKSPVDVTIIEIDLQQWMKDGKPGKVIHVRPPELNK
ncbi:MAG: hypothetical protein K2Y22_04570 [Candidatus Obscuribacterales bacterium]|nr:hypothetical protein [Candidatus Obscuribacterales bacterium]